MPSRGIVLNAAPSFQLFMTRRVAITGTSGGSRKSFDFKKATTVITLQSPDETELKILVSSLYPNCRDAADKLVSCYQALCQRVGGASSVSGRGFSLRDLLKWAHRLANSANEETLNPETVVLEGMDCFCNHLPVSEVQEQVKFENPWSKTLALRTQNSIIFKFRFLHSDKSRNYVWFCLELPF